MDASWREAITATRHCLTGCAIGEVLGMVIATAAGWGDLASISIAVLLAFFFGYLLTFAGQRRAGLPVAAAVRIALAADTVSIVVMEIVDNAILLAWPSAMEAGLDGPAVLGLAGGGAGDRVRGHRAGEPGHDRPRARAREGARRTTPGTPPDTPPDTAKQGTPNTTNRERLVVSACVSALAGSRGRDRARLRRLNMDRP